MDHGREYWFKNTFEKQKSDIHLEFYRLTSSSDRPEKYVNMQMNRCIKYTSFSIEDPQNVAEKEQLERILELEKQFKADPHNAELENELEFYFTGLRPEDKIPEQPSSGLTALLNLLDELDAPPQLRATVTQYDKNDNAIGTYTGTFSEVFGSIENPTDYYFRLTALDQNTIRDRVADTHFGVKTSCIGGLEFKPEETLNRYLNFQVRDYINKKSQTTFYPNFFSTISEFNSLATLTYKFHLLTKEGFNTEINGILKKYPQLEKVNDLNDYRKVSGIYILVLDKYNICYVGQAVDITQRIMKHWSRSDYFGQGIDIFKAKDTTRIYALPCTGWRTMNKYENQIIDLMDARYNVNILTGGTIDYHLENDIPLLKNPVDDFDFFNNFLEMQKSVEELEPYFIVD